MVSHKNFGGIELSIGKGGLRFKKRSSARNACIGAAMTGVKHSSLPKGAGGRYDTAFQDKFSAAVRGCPGGGRKVGRPKK